MRAEGSVRLPALEAAAARSGDGEAFALLEKRAGVRIGVGVRVEKGGTPRPFVEAILDPFPDRPRVDLDGLLRVGRLLATLRARGYELRVEDDGSVVAEAALAAPRVDEEVERIRDVLAEATD